LHERDCFLALRAPQITDLNVEGVLSAGREIKASADAEIGIRAFLERTPRALLTASDSSQETP
jgi:hypothetical protein